LYNKSCRQFILSDIECQYKRGFLPHYFHREMSQKQAGP
jgi:hypothetical protein